MTLNAQGRAGNDEMGGGGKQRGQEQGGVAALLGGSALMLGSKACAAQGGGHPCLARLAAGNIRAGITEHTSLTQKLSVCAQLVGRLGQRGGY